MRIGKLEFSVFTSKVVYWGLLTHVSQGEFPGKCQKPMKLGPYNMGVYTAWPFSFTADVSYINSSSLNNGSNCNSEFVNI